MRQRLVAIAVGCVIGVVAGSEAQTRVAVSGVGGLVPDATMVFRLPGPQLEGSVQSNLARGAFSATGRYFVAVRQDRSASVLLQLWVADLQTGTVWTLDLPSFNGAFVVPNPRSDEVYVQLVRGFDGPLWAVRPEGVRTLRTCAGTAPAVSRDGRRVFCYDQGLVWIDSATDTTVRTVDVGGIGVLFTDETGATVTIARPDGLSIYDSATGVTLRSAPWPLTPGFAYSRAFGTAHDGASLFVHGQNGGARETVLVDPNTSGAVQRLPLPADREVLSLEVIAAGTTALVASTTGLQSSVDVIDLPTNRLTGSTAAFASWPSLFLATTNAPLAPRLEEASVAGSRVNLSWTLPTASNGVSRWQVEAGSAPGATDLALFDVSATPMALSVSGVPAGRYYVRVRAVNVTGIGASSNEIVVVVP